MRILRDIVVIFLIIETTVVFALTGVYGMFLGLQLIAMIIYIIKTTKHLNNKQK